MNMTATVTERRKLVITCSSCGQEWGDLHRCPIPPQIDTTRYSDEALQQLADHIARVLEGRRRASA